MPTKPTARPRKLSITGQLRLLQPNLVESGSADTVPLGTITSVQRAMREAYDLGRAHGEEIGFDRADAWNKSRSRAISAIIKSLEKAIYRLRQKGGIE